MKTALRISKQIKRNKKAWGNRKAILTFRIHRKGVI